MGRDEVMTNFVPKKYLTKRDKQYNRQSQFNSLLLLL